MIWADELHFFSYLWWTTVWGVMNYHAGFQVQSLILKFIQDFTSYSLQGLTVLDVCFSCSSLLRRSSFGLSCTPPNVGEDCVASEKNVTNGGYFFSLVKWLLFCPVSTTTTTTNTTTTKSFICMTTHYCKSLFKTKKQKLNKQSINQIW